MLTAKVPWELAVNDRSRPSRVQIGACSFDPARAELLGPNGETVHLRPQSMRVLETLLAHLGTVVTREALIATVWPDVVVTDDSLVQCIRDIRRALGADHLLVHTVPRVGYRLDVMRLPEACVDRKRHRPILPSYWFGSIAAHLSGMRATRSPGPEGSHTILWKPNRRGALMLTGLAVGIALLGFGWFYAQSGVSTTWKGVRHRAIDVARNPTVLIRFRYDAPATALKESDVVFAAGSAAQLADDVVHNTTLRALVVPGTASDASIADLTHRLGAQFIVDGRVSVQATRLSLAADLVDASTRSVLWTERRESTVAQLPTDRASLLRRVAQSAHSSLLPTDGALVLPGTPQSLEVFQLVTRAQARAHRFDREDYRIARDELAQALRTEAAFAMGWAVRGYLDAIDASAGITGDITADHGAELLEPAERAIALDSRLVLAHQARALGLVSQGRHAEALLAAERAVSLSTSDPQGFLVLANALVINGRMAEAMRAIEQAQSRYPAPTALFDFVRAKVLWGNDRFDEAIDAASRCLEKAPKFATCHAIRAVASDAMSRLEAAREDLKAYRVAVPGSPTYALGPGSYGVPKLQNDWLREIRSEIGLP